MKKYFPKVATMALTMVLKSQTCPSIVIMNICVKLYQNLSINKSTRALIQFLKKATVTLTLDLLCLNPDLSTILLYLTFV